MHILQPIVRQGKVAGVCDRLPTCSEKNHFFRFSPHCRIRLKCLSVVCVKLTRMWFQFLPVPKRLWWSSRKFRAFYKLRARFAILKRRKNSSYGNLWFWFSAKHQSSNFSYFHFLRKQYPQLNAFYFEMNRLMQSTLNSDSYSNYLSMQHVV